jgi:pullulanase/glycogen debranching enzyme
MIDVVYNHTSPDSTLRRDHPDWFYLDAEGNFGNKIGDWDDVIDLDYDKLGLWTYQIETLTMWAKLVDGFRCDVASMIPMDFWRKARAAVERVHPNFIWLAETVHSPLAAEARALGYVSNTDYEMYDAFDMEYDYDIDAQTGEIRSWDKDWDD